MEWLTSPEIWIAFFTLTALEIVLGIDNIIFISILVGRLPPAQQPKARFFGLALATLLLRLDQSLLDSDAGRLLLRLVRWGDQQGGGQHYELMISTIYLVWGAFLWRAASQPFRHRLFIDFTVAANAAHFGLMFLQGLLMPGEHIHLAGDVLLGWASLVPLMLFWIPQRKRAAPSLAVERR